MAEDESSGNGVDWIWIIIGLVIIGGIVFGITVPFDPTYLNIEYLFTGLFAFVEGIINFLFYSQAGLILQMIIAGICVLMIVLIIYLIIRLFEMEKEHADHVYHKTDHLDAHETHQPLSRGAVINETPAVAKAHLEALETDPTEPRPGQPKWEVVLDHISSQHASDWRMAIIEADTILEALVEGQGYAGDGIGERLKSAGQGAFRTYNDAWEAHKVRNNIAHQGADFQLTYREAKQTIDRYENVFREFDYI